MLKNHPSGLPYIIGNEGAERFSYYGMKSILVVYMTTALMDSSGVLRTMSEREATFWYHIFGMANYCFPIFGALIADAFWGKYRTIIILSLVYCAGHLALAVDDTRLGLVIGLIMIAVGSGGIKPCVSAHLGDQYRSHSPESLSKGYSLFYISINVGALVSSVCTPLLLERYGAGVAFSVPGALMAVATFIFWRGRPHYVVQSPTPWRAYLHELAGGRHRSTCGKVLLLFLVLSIFWSLFDQTGSSWILQAERMNRVVALPGGGSFEVLPAQVQAINPVLIVVLAPLFTWIVYPSLAKRGALSTRGKVVGGMLLAGVSFVLLGYVQRLIASGEIPSIGWQLLAYFILTIAEVVVSITTLELAYTAAPSAYRSLMTSFYLLSVSLGNGFTALATGPLASWFGEPTTPRFFFAFGGLSILAAYPAWKVLRTLSTATEASEVKDW